MNIKYIVASLAVLLGCQEAKPCPVVEAPLPVPPLSQDEERVQAVLFWASALGVSFELALAVSYRENASGDPKAWSKTGCCVGIMQVNLIHYGEYDELCGGSDLMSVNDNACYGVAILRDKLEICLGDTKCALRRYSGYVGDKWRVKGDSYVTDVLEHAQGLAP